MIHIVDNDILRGTEKLGYLSGNDVFDRNSRKMGYHSSDTVYDLSGRKLGYIKDGHLRQPDGDNVASLMDIHKEITGGTISDIERAAIRLLIGN